MFKNLTNFAYKRSFKEAVGFYVAYNLLFLISSMLLGALSAILFSYGSHEQAREVGFRAGQVVNLIAPLVLSFLVFYKKKLLNHFGFFMLVFVGPLLALFSGGFVGMIPVAFFTMLSGKNTNV